MPKTPSVTCGSCQSFQTGRAEGAQPTLQFLHFHTKLASPRLPLISLFSCAPS